MAVRIAYRTDGRAAAYVSASVSSRVDRPRRRYAGNVLTSDTLATASPARCRIEHVVTGTPDTYPTKHVYDCGDGEPEGRVNGSAPACRLLCSATTLSRNGSPKPAAQVRSNTS